MPVPPQCQPLAESIAEMEQERADLQEELSQASPGEKAGLVRQIKALNARLLVARNQLADCVAAHQQPPPPPPLEAVFDGQFSLTTSSDLAPGPYSMSTTLGLLFNGERTFVAVTSFPAVTASFDTPIGRNVTTVTKVGGGSGSYSAGALLVPVRLRFDHSIDLPFFEEDSELPLLLSTNTPGSPVNAAGAVTLAGSGQFVGGVLAGATGTIVVTGTITPSP